MRPRIPLPPLPSPWFALALVLLLPATGIAASARPARPQAPQAPAAPQAPEAPSADGPGASFPAGEMNGGAAGAADGGGAVNPAWGQTDPAYTAGYRAAYPLGQADANGGAAANPHKYRLYQQASSGYTDLYGSPDSYRSAYQSGFKDGYADGYANREPSISLTPAPVSAAAGLAPSPAAALPALPAEVKTARANGYREGYSVGQADADRQAAYNPDTSQEYRDALVGYASGLGGRSQYQLNFRSGFADGYSDGFYHRLYNTAVGARQVTRLAAQRAGANDLPTDPERLRARPSGVYSNGVLIAEGTRVQTTLDRTIDTKTARVGDPFSVTVSVPVWVGAVAAIPAGSVIQGRIQDVKRGGHFSGSARLQLQYTTLVLPGQAPITLQASTAGVGAGAQTVNPDEGTVNGKSPETGKHIATGAAIGAVLGGIFGGGGGILRGGAAGAAAGTAGVLLSHHPDMVLHQGEAVSLRLDRPLELPGGSGSQSGPVH